MMMMILILIVKEHISTQDIDRRWTLRISIIRIENLEEALFFADLLATIVRYFIIFQCSPRC